MGDTLTPQYRQQANHFVSWVWSYNLFLVRSGLSRWAHRSQANTEDVFLFMCFFCNNQWRILVEKSSQGSDNLGTTFENRLTRVGRLIALMDAWEHPVYTRRIWTIYEQYVAAKLHIETDFVLPEDPASTLIQQLDLG